jgi:peptide/nickel transport system substrate-binding protein
LRRRISDGFEWAQPANFVATDVAQSIQETMGRAGIKVSIVPGEQKQIITKYRARNHGIVLLYWSPDYMDPHTNADSFARNPDNADDAKSKPLAWRNAWDIPEITKETDAAVRERDPEKRKDMYLALQKKVRRTPPCRHVPAHRHHRKAGVSVSSPARPTTRSITGW